MPDPNADRDHRSRLQRLGRVWIDWPTYFITTCTFKRRPILASNEVARILADELRDAHDRHGWAIGRYVIMPDHVHFFCAPFDHGFTLKQWMNFWRNGFTKAWQLKGDKPIWQKDYWDTQLRRGESYTSKWEYVRQNPVRSGLLIKAEHWLYQGELETLPWLEV